MQLQVPNAPVAETRNFAGPWLRLGNGGEPGKTTWHGSVLCVTREAALASATAGLPPPQSDGYRNGVGTAGAVGTGPPPVLTLDASAGHEGMGSQKVEAQALDTCLGWTFWRMDLELPLLEWQRPVQYSVSAGGATTTTYTFWLPAAGQPMHWGYYSCNGLSSDVAPSAPELADPTYLWRDLLQLHAAFPLHCAVGGGDQVYSDGVWQCPAFKAWGCMPDRAKKVVAEWTPQMEAEATRYYLTNYMNALSAPDIDVALAQIPQVMMWDDHDIWDGWGSYDPDLQNCSVFQNLFRVARRFFLLYQQHTTDALNAHAREFLGPNDSSAFHFVRWMGPQVVLLGMDMRSQRTKDRIMPQSAYDLFNSVVASLPRGPLHLVVLSGVPVIFPRIPAAESILGCVGGCFNRLPAVKNMARTTGLLDRFDQPEILDDLIDGWVAEVHAEERKQFISMLQGWTTSKGLRISILSGDAHVGGVGRFYSRPKIKDVADDPLFMCQIISSAIVNAPPPHPVVKMLMRTNFAANVDDRTREKLVRAFWPRHPRTDKLIAKRNWCDVCLVAPPFSSPTVPQDPGYGGLLFQLRVEDATHRRGYAEETYRIMVPRHPNAAMSPAGSAGAAGSMGAVPANVPLPAPRGATSQEEQGQRRRQVPGNVVLPEGQGGAAPSATAGKVEGPPAGPGHGAAAGFALV